MLLRQTLFAYKCKILTEALIICARQSLNLLFLIEAAISHMKITSHQTHPPCKWRGGARPGHTTQSISQRSPVVSLWFPTGLHFLEYLRADRCLWNIHANSKWLTRARGLNMISFMPSRNYKSRSCQFELLLIEEARKLFSGDAMIWKFACFFFSTQL